MDKKCEYADRLGMCENITATCSKSRTMRLIDANNAISVLKIISDKCYDDNAFEQAISVLESVPTVDAVAVVRCKDCKYKPSWREGVKEEFRDGFELIFPDWRDNPCPCQCDDGFYAHMPDDNWFCAFGERKCGE